MILEVDADARRKSWKPGISREIGCCFALGWSRRSLGTLSQEEYWRTHDLCRCPSPNELAVSQFPSRHACSSRNSSLVTVVVTGPRSPRPSRVKDRVLMGKQYLQPDGRVPTLPKNSLALAGGTFASGNGVAACSRTTTELEFRKGSLKYLINRQCRQW